MMKRESDDGKYRTTAVNLSHHLTIQVCHLVPGEKSLLSVCTMNLQLAISLRLQRRSPGLTRQGLSRSRATRREKDTKKARFLAETREVLSGGMHGHQRISPPAILLLRHKIFIPQSFAQSKSKSKRRPIWKWNGIHKSAAKIYDPRFPSHCSIGWEATYTKTRQNLRPSQIPRPSSW